MKLFRHVLNTWLLSHFFHPLLFSFCLIIMGDPFAGPSIPVLYIVGPLVSIPSLLLSWLFLHGLHRYNTHSLIKQVLWMVLMPVSAGCNFLLLAMFSDSFELFFREAVYLIPAVLAIWVAILFRTYQFQDLFIHNTIHHESSLL